MCVSCSDLRPGHFLDNKWGLRACPLCRSWGLGSTSSVRVLWIHGHRLKAEKKRKKKEAKEAKKRKEEEEKRKAEEEEKRKAEELLRNETANQTETNGTDVNVTGTEAGAPGAEVAPLLLHWQTPTKTQGLGREREGGAAGLGLVCDPPPPHPPHPPSPSKESWMSDLC